MIIVVGFNKYAIFRIKKKHSPYVCLLIPQLTILIQIDSRITNIDHDFVDVYDVSRNI